MDVWIQTCCMWVHMWMSINPIHIPMSLVHFICNTSQYRFPRDSTAKEKTFDIILLLLSPYACKRVSMRSN